MHSINQFSYLQLHQSFLISLLLQKFWHWYLTFTCPTKGRIVIMPYFLSNGCFTMCIHVNSTFSTKCFAWNCKITLSHSYFWKFEMKRKGFGLRLWEQEKGEGSNQTFYLLKITWFVYVINTYSLVVSISSWHTTHLDNTCVTISHNNIPNVL